jgi:hypothetical protein
MREGMKLEVECYSGRKMDKRPVIRLEHEYLVEEVLDQSIDEANRSSILDK